MDGPAAGVVSGWEVGADLVLVGSGGPGSVRRAVAAATSRAALGRASNTVIRTAHCPVLVAHGDRGPGEPG